MAKSKKTEPQRSPGRAHKPTSAGRNGGKRATAQSASAAATVMIDRRTSGDRRKESERRKASQPVAVERRKIERRVKVSRRRQIDPTTCERDYTNDEIEFMSALDAYKRSSGRMFPTCSEILEVVRKLGYEKRPVGPVAAQAPSGPAASQPGRCELPETAGRCEGLPE